MGVSITSKSGTTDNLLAKLGEALDLKAEAAAILSTGHDVYVRPKRLVVAESEKGSALASLTFNTDLVPLLIAGKVLADGKALLRERVLSLLTEAMSQLGLDPGDFGQTDGATVVPDPDEAPPTKGSKKAGIGAVKVSVKDALGPHEPDDDPAPAPLKVASGYYEGSLADPVVKLYDAKYLHQPVRGSSGDSRYFVVAMDDKVKVAARLKATGDTGGMSVSVRVEGPGLEDVASRLKELGFTVGKGYQSLHVTRDSGGSLLATKTVGALVASLNLAGVMSTAVERLINKGS